MDNIPRLYLNCNSTDECPDAFICYKDVVWTDDRNFCSCNTRFGWVGDDCDELGPSTYFFIGLNVAQLVIMSGFWFMSSYDLFVYYAIKDGNKTNATLTTSALNTTSMFTFMLWKTLRIFQMLSPAEQNTNVLLIEMTNGMIVITLVLSTLALLNISLMWLEVGYRASKMKTKISSNLRRYKRVVWIFETCFVLLILLLVLIGKWHLALVVASPFIVFIISTYAVGAYRMGKLLNSSSFGNFHEKYRKILQHIYKTAQAVIVFLSLIIITGVANSALTIGEEEWKTTTRPTWYKPSPYLVETMEISCGLLMIFMYRYIHSNIDLAIVKWTDGSSSHGRNSQYGSPAGMQVTKGENLTGTEATSVADDTHVKSNTNDVVISFMESSQEESEQISLSQVLRDDKLVKKFTAYCKKMKANEDLKFWLTVHEFEKKFRANPHWNKAQNVARDIVEQYLLPGSKHSITVSDENLKEILCIHDSLDGKLYEPNSFKNVKKEIYDLLRDNFLYGFLQQEKTEIGKH